MNSNLVSVDPAQHIFSAACVQRFPLLGRVKTDLEIRVDQFKVSLLLLLLLLLLLFQKYLIGSCC